MQHYKELKKQAIEIYRKSFKTKGIAAQLGCSERTVRTWVADFKKNFAIDPNISDIADNAITAHLGGTQAKNYNGAINQQLNLDIKNGTVVVFSDAHILPHQDYSAAAQALLKVCKEIKPEYVINGGDTYDFSSISRHDKLGWEQQFTIKEEIEAGETFLNELYNVTLGARHMMLEGNHDTRMNKFLAKHLPQFKGVKGFDFRDHIPKGWEYTMSILVNKNTMFLHMFNSGVHAGYNNVVKSGMSVVCGHTHQLEVKPFSDYNGTRFGIQTGTLATIKNNPLFNYTLNTPLNWQSGFVVLTYINGLLQYPEVCNVNSDGQAVFRGKVVA